jgi:predicted LPLAT superfamily acyltransferase
LHVPVVLCIGLYRGGNRYDLHFELISEELSADRRQRREKLQAIVQDFANRLATQVRAAPYNWFNFYDFWTSNQLGRGLADDHDDLRRRR